MWPVSLQQEKKQVQKVQVFDHVKNIMELKHAFITNKTFSKCFSIIVSPLYFRLKQEKQQNSVTRLD